VLTSYVYIHGEDSEVDKSCREEQWLTWKLKGMNLAAVDTREGKNQASTIEAGRAFLSRRHDESGRHKQEWKPQLNLASLANNLLHVCPSAPSRLTGTTIPA
jgi:hypothetical protein